MRLLKVLALALVACVVTAFNATDEEEWHRRLQRAGGSGAARSASSTGIRAARRNDKRAMAKGERMKKLLRAIESPVPAFLKPDVGSKPHTKNGPAIFAAAMSLDMRRADALMFCGTARKAKFDGDLVIAVLPNQDAGFMAALRENKATIYTVQPLCSGERHDQVCSFQPNEPKFSINMVRFYLYQWWTRSYSEEALIMLSDFRDVFFQSNPFTYRAWDWAPPVSQLVVFQEAYPNKVIYRCPFNGGWISSCYGKEGLMRVGSNTVSCSGVTIGTRDSIFVYAHLITQQLDPRVRYGRNTTESNKQCISLGMDQGFHNWLVYSGQLDKYMDLKVYQQGEGPINTVGAFFPGERALLKFNLKTWNVLRGEAPSMTFHNWNGDLSPVIHQADRFLDKDLKGGYGATLKVTKGLQ